MLALLDELVLPVVRAFGGRRVKTIGDAYLLLFESPTSALLCGTALQDRMWDHGRRVPPEQRIEVKVVVSLGEVRLVGGGAVPDDVFGEAVNLAARIEADAAAGEVWLSEAVRLVADPRPGRDRGPRRPPPQGHRGGGPALPGPPRGRPKRRGRAAVRRRRPRPRARGAAAGPGDALPRDPAPVEPDLRRGARRRGARRGGAAPTGAGPRRRRGPRPGGLALRRDHGRAPDRAGRPRRRGGRDRGAGGREGAGGSRGSSTCAGGSRSPGSRRATGACARRSGGGPGRSSPAAATPSTPSTSRGRHGSAIGAGLRRAPSARPARPAHSGRCGASTSGSRRPPAGWRR